MRNLYPIFYNRDFSGVVEKPSLMMTVTDFSHTIRGGPENATITVTGGDVAKWGLAELLRCPVVIVNDMGVKVWWGYVEAVQITAGNMTFGLSVEKMVNKVIVLGEEMVIAGAVGTEAAAYTVQNDDSVSYYGTKEGRYNLGDASTDQVQGFAAAQLDLLKYPIMTVQPGGVGETRIICKGWFSTLAWRYIYSAAGLEEYTTIGTHRQAFGDAAGSTRISQSFQLVSDIGWDANRVSVRLEKIGAPTDTVTVAIYSDSSGSPGSSLASGTITGANVSTYLDWVDINMSARYALSVGTTYWVHLSRSGANDGSNYYRVSVNEGLGYSRGACRLYNGSTWVARSPDADMLFKVSGVRETTTQIDDMVTAYGAFLVDTLIETASGVYMIPYRDGSQTVLQVVKELLDSGASSKRLVCLVGWDRRVRIFTEPTSAHGSDFIIHSDGKLYDFLDQPLRPEMYRPGVWARMRNVLPASLSQIRVSAPGLLFIEEAGYRNGEGYFRPRLFDSLMEVNG